MVDGVGHRCDNSHHANFTRALRTDAADDANFFADEDDVYVFNVGIYWNVTVPQAVVCPSAQGVIRLATSA